jgi:hypothetical protein
MTAYVPVPRTVIEDLLDSDGEVMKLSTVRADLRAALRRPSTPPWHHAAEGISQLRELVDERGPRAVGELDQLRGSIRDELDRLDVSLRDEFAIYHGLVWVGLVVEIARNGFDNGYVDPPTFLKIREIVTTIASALLEYVPKDAFR